MNATYNEFEEIGNRARALRQAGRVLQAAGVYREAAALLPLEDEEETDGPRGPFGWGSDWLAWELEQFAWDAALPGELAAALLREAAVLWRSLYERYEEPGGRDGIFENLVKALIRAGEMEEAVSLHREQLGQGRVCVWAGYALAESLAEAGQLDRGLDLFGETVRAAATAEYLDAWTYSVSLCFTARLARQAGRVREALSLYREAVEQAPRNPHALYEYGETLEEAGRLEEAREQWKRALALGTTTLKTELRQKLE